MGKKEVMLNLNMPYRPFLIIAYHELHLLTIPPSANHLREMQWGRLEYFVPAESLTWAAVFGTLERSRQHLPIEDYSVTQTTLERVSQQFLGPVGSRTV